MQYVHAVYQRSQIIAIYIYFPVRNKIILIYVSRFMKVLNIIIVLTIMIKNESNMLLQTINAYNVTYINKLICIYMLYVYTYTYIIYITNGAKFSRNLYIIHIYTHKIITTINEC